ncbi:MAG: class I SAM-dependent methyltransferase [Planctomycetes bacterium]|nr:class I SAM-dependent methyltransferase [Planctomycetota bacterium]
MTVTSTLSERLLANGRLPDWLVRAGIRRRLRARLRRQHVDDPERVQGELMRWVRECERQPLAVATAAANAQHYEVPAGFFAAVLGKHRKYSCGLWTHPTATLDEADAAMLELTCRRGQLADGMTVLDLGCGWGALSLWIAERHPRCRVLGVSNSRTQRDDILARARARGLTNVDIVTADVNTFATDHRFDRVFSVEMMEHCRNWRELLRRIAGWLQPDGRLFVHVFTHRNAGYPFAVDGDGDWMARQFFTGGQMPADSQLLYWQDDLRIEDHWRVSGDHYRRTSEAWLHNLDRAREQVLPLLGDDAASSRRQFHAWRTFFLACAELWGHAGGREWFVSHYLAARR